MMLFVDGTSEGILCTNIGYWVKDHESAFEILTQLVADDWILQRAAVIDGYDRMDVPIEVFDGQPIQIHIRALQQQWRQILTKEPVYNPATDSNQQLKNWYERLDAYYEEMLVHLDKMILILKMSQSKINQQPDAPLKRRMDDQYDSLIDSNQRMHQQTKADRERNRLRLNRLNMG